MTFECVHDPKAQVVVRTNNIINEFPLSHPKTEDLKLLDNKSNFSHPENAFQSPC